MDDTDDTDDTDDMDDIPAKIFGNWVTIFRLEAHLSQEALAEAAEVSVDEVRKLEIGRLRREPRLETYTRLIQALGLLEPGQEQNLRLFDEAYFALVAARHPHGDRLRVLHRRVFRPIDWPLSARILLLGSLAAVLALVLVTRCPGQLPIPSGRLGGARLTSSAASLQGWTVTVEQVGKNSTVLIVTDLRTKRSYPLLPTNATSATLPSDGEAFLDPQYSPRLHAIAYIHVWHQARSLWLASLSFQVGEPRLAPGGLHELVNNCAPCGTLAWAQSADWLIYDGANGLLAVSPQSHVIRQLTHGSYDAWPSCTPDGRWLVYQHAIATAGYVVRVPAADCLPLGDPSELQRLVAGPILGWHPAISPDGRYVAFNASPGGIGRQSWHVYIASLASASPSMNPAGSRGDRPAIYAASPRGCVDPTWVNGTGSPTGVLVYVCGAQLVAALAEPHPARRIGILEDTEAIGPTLYNPAWIPVP